LHKTYSVLKSNAGGRPIARKEKPKLGALLVKEGLITQKQLDEALKTQVIYGGRLGTNLVELGYLDEEALAYFLSEHLEVPYAHPKTLLEIDPKIIALIPRTMAEKYKILPFSVKRKRLRMIMIDPLDLETIRELSFITGFIIEPMVTPEAQLLEALEKYYGIPRVTRYRHPAQAPAKLTDSQPQQVQPAEETLSNAPAVSGTPPDEVSEEIIQEKLLKIREKRTSMIMSGLDINPTLATPAEALPIADRDLKNAPDRDSIASAMIDFTLSKFPRAAILIVRGDKAEGWKGAGMGFTDEFVQRIKIPLSVPSALKEAAEKGFALHGDPDSWPLDKMMRKLLRVEESLDIAVTSVNYQKAVVCFLVAVVPRGAVDTMTKKEFIEVAEKAGRAFARLIKESRKKERGT